jgi:Fic-DOC domain mobile mystery protein B
MSDESAWAPIAGETPIDISGLKIRGVTNRRELNRAEAHNVRKAFAKYLLSRPSARSAPFDYKWSLKLHREMFGDVWKWAGSIRAQALNLGCAPHLIAEQLAHLLGDLNSWDSFQIGLAEQAAMLHHRAVQIHPFHNGNGRWGRLLANIWLARHAAPLIEWPEQVIGDQSVIRDAYLSSLRWADEGDYGPLIDLQQRHAAKT